MPSETCTTMTIWGFPKSRGTSLGVPMIRIIIFGGLYWGPLNLGNYYINPKYSNVGYSRHSYHYTWTVGVGESRSA